MKKQIFTILILSFIARIGYAQESKNENHLDKSLEIYGGIGPKMLGLTYFQPINDRFIFSIGSGSSGFASFERTKIYYSVFVDTNLKYIYNREKRLLKNKPLNNNSGSFVKTGVFYNPYIVNRKIYHSSPIMYLSWGQRYNTNRSFSFEYELTTESSLKNLKFGYSFNIGFIYSIPIFKNK